MTMSTPRTEPGEPSPELLWHLTSAGFPARAWYKDLPIYADSIHVHEEAFKLLETHARKDGLVADIGAGAGAFSRRMLDNGFTIEALELDPAAFKISDVPVHSRDLNSDWSHDLEGRFTGAVALEVIEHLENPWHFARQCGAILKPGGIMVLSTPNIESSRSRIEFLLRADFRFFDEDDYRDVGHITPLTSRYIQRVFERAGFEIVERRYSRHKGVRAPLSLRKALRFLIYILSYPFMQGTKHGEASIFCFRKK